MTLDSIKQQLAAAGLDCESFHVDGRLHRCAVDGDRGRKLSGWYVLHEHRTESGRTLIFGAYGNYKTGTGSLYIMPDSSGATPAELAAMRQRQEDVRAQAETARKQVAKEAADRAEKILAGLQQSGPSEYLKTKLIGNWGLYFTRGSIVIPIRSMRGRLRGLQFINGEGGKKFLTGTNMSGSVHVLREPEGPSMPVVFAEGYSTAAAFMGYARGSADGAEQGCAVVCCFNCGNLKPAMQAARKRWPENPFAILVDDDSQTRRPDGQKVNPGLDSAISASKAVNAYPMLPYAQHVAGRQGANQGARLDAFARTLAEDRPPWDWCDELCSIRKADTERAAREVVSLCLRVISEVQLPAVADAGTPALEIGDSGEWMEAAAASSKGWKRPSQRAVELILSNDREICERLGFDLFSDQIVKLSSPPWGGEAGEWRDKDSAHCVSWLSKRYGLEPGAAVLNSALQVAADQHQVHAVREWLHELPEPSTSLLDCWLSEGLGSPEEKPYLKAIGRAWLISAIARVMNPGCKADAVLVLEGPQGRFKSTAIAELFGAWYSDQPIVFGDKDAYLAIRGIWCLELAELDSWRKAENTQSKAFFSQRVDRYRPPYGHRMTEVRRQCVFVGTTNQDEYLRDPTGNRRYWPVRVGWADLDWLRENREALFSEALAAYRAGEQWWLDDEGEALAAQVRDSRIQEDPWEETLGRWLAANWRRRHSTEELLVTAIGIDKHAITIMQQTRVAYVMQSLGYSKTRWQEDGIQVRGYVKRGEATPPSV